MMKLSALRKKLVSYTYFLPVRIHLILLLVTLFLGAGWIQRNNALPQTARTAIINIFVIVTFWFALVLLIFSFLTAFIPWLIFILRTAASAEQLRVSIPEGAFQERQPVGIDLYPVFKPLFGYLRLRFFMNEEEMSPKLMPTNPGVRRSLISLHLNGLYHWPLTHIKEYDIRGAIVYFEDFFQFFSFASQISVTGNFFTPPPGAKVPRVMAQPKRTDDIQIRIAQLRRVQGELLNYKNFETNDDVRRIVWKIYARNKELVVRVPENLDPYASHLHFYASFHDCLRSDLFGDIKEVLLDHYKTIVWNIYDQLHRQNEAIRFIPDQETRTFPPEDPLALTRFQISTANWQKTHNLTDYFNAKYGSVLCLSSLNDPDQVSEILEKSGSQLWVILVRLSSSFPRTVLGDWLKWFFVQPGIKNGEALRMNFHFSPLKNGIMENEKKLQKILDQSECAHLEVDADIAS